jgi:hypothetical protein
MWGGTFLPTEMHRKKSRKKDNPKRFSSNHDIDQEIEKKSHNRSIHREEVKKAVLV